MSYELQCADCGLLTTYAEAQISDIKGSQCPSHNTVQHNWVEN